MIEAGPLSSATDQSTVIQADGAYLLPGIVDLHNDNWEFEFNPRANANLPLTFALHTMDRRLAAAGVTTEFHAVYFQDRPNKQRHLAGAEVVGAGAVVTKDVDPYVIVGGVPAKPIRERFPRQVAEQLQAIAWWDWPRTVLEQRFDELNDLEEFLHRYGR